MRLTFEHLTANTVFMFLEYLEAEQNCSILTRNARFAVIRAFMDYAADHDVTLADNLNKLKKVPFKKPDCTAGVDYMGMAVIMAIIEKPGANTPKGLRDRFFMILLYDTGARIQEILDIKLCDVQFGRFPKVTLFGKGRKTRVVPLMEKTIQHLKKFLSIFHEDSVLNGGEPLFYSVIQGSKHQLSDRRIRYILQNYGEQAKKFSRRFPKKYVHIVNGCGQCGSPQV